MGAEEKLPPQPYAYEYGVADDYSKANFKKTETQDANGVVAGSFVIALPDGRIQTTTWEFHRNHITKCTSLSLLLPSSPQLSLPAPPPMVPLLPTRRRSSPLSLMLMNTELLMTTARPTSRRQKHKMPTVSLPVAS